MPGRKEMRRASTLNLMRFFASRPDARDFLVSRRNRTWLGTINPLLQRPGTTMITVGAAHIGGKNGLLALICSEGYRVERLLDKGGVADACHPVSQ